MSATEFLYGLIVRGGVFSPRKLCDFRAAYMAYAEGETDGSECYLSAFSFGADMLEHMERNGSTAGFSGALSAEYIPFDIDADSGDLDGALSEARRLAVLLLDKYSVSESALQIWFSGRRGFHLLLPAMGLYLAPGERFHEQVKRLALRLAEEAEVTIDASIYDRVHILRAPNSKHGKTGLFKIPLSADELLKLDAARICELAKAPCPADLVPASELGPWCDGQRPGLSREVVEETPGRVESGLGTYLEKRISKDTLRYIREGDTFTDGRKMGLFRAAANLAECGVPGEVIEALLVRQALDSGIAPAVVDKQVRDGIHHGGRGGS